MLVLAELYWNLKDILNIGGYYSNSQKNNDDSYLFIKNGDGRFGRSNQLLSVSYKDFSVDTLYDHSTAEKKIPGFGTFTHINRSSDGMYWLTTYGEGFTRYDISTGNIKHYGINNGLPNSYLYCIFEDKSGYLWMSSNYGIIRFNPRTN